MGSEDVLKMGKPQTELMRTKMVHTNKRCKHIKREGESCTLNNNCTYPDCEIETNNDTKR